MRQGDNEEMVEHSMCGVLSQGPSILWEEKRIRMASWSVLGLQRMSVPVTLGKSSEEEWV